MAVKDVSLGCAIGLPVEALDQSTSPECQLDRLDYQRAGNQHRVALRQGKGVHIGGLAHTDRRKDARRAPGRLREQLVLRAGAELGRVSDQRTAGGVPVGVRGGKRSRSRRLDIQRLKRLRVKDDGHRRLGHGHVLLAQASDVDGAVIRDLWGDEQRRQATKQRAAGVAGELLKAKATGLLRGAEGFATQEAVAVADLAIADAEAVQHRQAIKPVIQTLCAQIPLRGPCAQQRS